MHDDNQNKRTILLDKLQELLTESISGLLLKSPRLWGEHTLSKNTINRLAVLRDDDGCKFIVHPYTREKFYFIEQAPQFPENTIINDFILLFWYCKITLQINYKNLTEILEYFLKLLMINQKLINQIGDIFYDNKIHNLVLKELAELLECTKEVIMILSGTQVLSYSNNGKPPDCYLNGILFMAIKHNYPRLAKLLMSEKLTINVALTDQKGKSSLHWACYHGHQSIAETLIDNKANINLQDSNTHATPLFLACYKGDLQLAETLIKRGAHINVKNIHEQTPFKIAFNARKVKIAEMLVDNGARESYHLVKDRNGVPLFLWKYEDGQQQELIDYNTSILNTKKKSQYKCLK